jgi:hypothetical protein
MSYFHIRERLIIRGELVYEIEEAIVSKLVVYGEWTTRQ